MKARAAAFLAPVLPFILLACDLPSPGSGSGPADGIGAPTSASNPAPGTGTNNPANTPSSPSPMNPPAMTEPTPPSTPDAGPAHDAGPPAHADASTPPPVRDAGAQPEQDAGAGAPDSGATPPDAGTVQCIAPVGSPGSGEHNPGRDCMNCHNFTVAGTLFTSVTGGSGISGATIEVIDANGATLHLPTYANGNFYTSRSVSFPIRVRSSKCPNDAPMVSPASSGACNASGCHVSTFQVHLP